MDVAIQSLKEVMIEIKERRDCVRPDKLIQHFETLNVSGDLLYDKSIFSKE